MATPALIRAARENGKKGGRPKGSGNPHEKARQEAEALFIAEAKKHLPEIITALTEAAKGMYVEVRNKKGEPIRVFRKPPETAALKEYLDRVMGKARQPIEFETPLEVEHTFSERAKELLKPFIDDDTTESEQVAGKPAIRSRKRTARVDKKIPKVKK